MFRDLRAGAESGWDFSSRWMADGQTLATIQTTAIVPVDLNSLIYGLEKAISEGCADCVREFDGLAAARAEAINFYLWDAAKGAFLDYQWTSGQRLDRLSAATFYPLFVGAADERHAHIVAQKAWAPLQWVAVAGLRRYGEDALAAEIAKRWLATVEREYKASGKMLEKYDVEQAKAGGGGEYPTQDGFGWTNGVTRALMEGVGAARRR